MPGLLEQSGGKLEISKSGADWAFLQKDEDLKLRGHYIVRWKWRITGPATNVFAFAGISGALLTAGEATTGTFFGNGVDGKTMFRMFPLLGIGEPGHINIIHFYRDANGTVVNIKSSISASAWPQSLEVTDELEYDGTNIFFRSDVDGVTGFTPIQRNTTVPIALTVKDFDSHHFMIGVPHTNTGSGIKIFGDDVQILTVAGP